MHIWKVDLKPLQISELSARPVACRYGARWPRAAYFAAAFTHVSLVCMPAQEDDVKRKMSM